MILRPPTAYDLPPLYTLALDQKDKFLDDYTTFDLGYAKEVISSPTTIVIDDHGYAAGIAWFSDINDELRAEIHLLIRPEYWRQVIKEDTLSQVLDMAFDTLKVNKIIAEPMSTMKTALKVLRKHKFYEHKPFYKHTKQNGVIVDVIRFELRKKYWRRNGNG